MTDGVNISTRRIHGEVYVRMNDVINMLRMQVALRRGTILNGDPDLEFLADQLAEIERTHK